jgi:hypothetical protein
LAKPASSSARRRLPPNDEDEQQQQQDQEQQDPPPAPVGAAARARFGEKVIQSPLPRRKGLFAQYGWFWGAYQRWIGG